MKIKNIPADIKSKSLKEARNEINEILTKLEKKSLSPFSNKDYVIKSKRIGKKKK